ncbi:hypothetical protein TYRP_019424 [Tyrophagus putrescentiae]|nr:hypothetical protein TYRP_019424 [Tyrophagus putrescentiae]
MYIFCSEHLYLAVLLRRGGRSFGGGDSGQCRRFNCVDGSSCCYRWLFNAAVLFWDYFFSLDLEFLLEDCIRGGGEINRRRLFFHFGSSLHYHTFLLLLADNHHLLVGHLRIDDHISVAGFLFILCCVHRAQQVRVAVVAVVVERRGAARRGLVVEGVRPQRVMVVVVAIRRGRGALVGAAAVGATQVNAAIEAAVHRTGRGGARRVIVDGRGAVEDVLEG